MKNKEGEKFEQQTWKDKIKFAVEVVKQAWKTAKKSSQQIWINDK